MSCLQILVLKFCLGLLDRVDREIPQMISQIDVEYVNSFPLPVPARISFYNLLFIVLMLKLNSSFLRFSRVIWHGISKIVMGSWVVQLDRTFFSTKTSLSSIRSPTGGLRITRRVTHTLLAPNPLIMLLRMRFNSQSGSDPLPSCYRLESRFCRYHCYFVGVVCYLLWCRSLIHTQISNFTWDFVEMLYWMILGWYTAICVKHTCYSDQR